jgi:hypothetical protein
MGRGDTNPRGMPPSRNTVWSRPAVSEEEFESNWERAFGRTGPNKDLVIEKKESENRNRIRLLNDEGK